MFKSVLVLSLAASSVYGHAFISSVAGANGLSSTGFGVDTTGSIPRNGTFEQPFQLDTPVLKNLQDDPCGANLLSGSINIATEMATAIKANGGALPTIPTNGALTLGVFQINADGGGPFAAEVNTDGTGKTWTAVTVTSQPPGINGLLQRMPNTLACTGGSTGDACIIRLNNGGENTGSMANGAGPFGGCVAVSQANAATGTASNNTASAANGATGTASNNTASAANGATGTASNNTASAASGTAAAASTASSTSTKSTKTKGSNKNNKNNRSIRDVVKSRHFFPSLAARRSALDDLVSKREALDAEILAKRQLLNAQLIDELKTATGTAIDIPIDAFAGHIDESALGGNATKAAGSILSDQQAVDLKKAVQDAIESAFDIMASAQVDAGANGQDSTITDAANAEAAAELVSGALTSINAGNAGVGFFNTASVDALLGGIATATADLGATATAAGSAATTTAATAASGVSAASSAIATSSSSSKSNKGTNVKGAKGGNNNGATNGRFGRNRLARDHY
ncbi:hypothetical protein EW146_g5807 [Bondarzewia mesenterica]|uniref:Uncharacterized protein n=1 Tax=Bondarzewia mesenterica TaxID=1095465 RepID=A0A4S4LQZ8_9AGAM|nr:hypothetical protein EW146_g5807 [Bondarzewia mesenterica]